MVLEKGIYLITGESKFNTDISKPSRRIYFTYSYT